MNFNLTDTSKNSIKKFNSNSVYLIRFEREHSLVSSSAMALLSILTLIMAVRTITHF